MQLLRLINGLLKKHPESQSRKLAAHAPIIVSVCSQVRSVGKHACLAPLLTGATHVCSGARVIRESRLLLPSCMSVQPVFLKQQVQSLPAHHVHR